MLVFANVTLNLFSFYFDRGYPESFVRGGRALTAFFFFFFFFFFFVVVDERVLIPL